MINLNTKQKQYLKSLAHTLKPVVMLGNKNLTEAVLNEIKRALAHHELIKIKIALQERENRAIIISDILAKTSAYHVQTIGNIVVLYRPLKESKISFSN